MTNALAIQASGGIETAFRQVHAGCHHLHAFPKKYASLEVKGQLMQSNCEWPLQRAYPHISKGTSAVTIRPINRSIDEAAINRIEISPSINRSSRVLRVNHTCICTALRQRTVHLVQVQREGKAVIPRARKTDVWDHIATYTS